MCNLNIARLSDRAHCLRYINVIRALQKSGEYSLIPDRNWILAAVLPDKRIRILDIGPCSFVFHTLLDRSQTDNYEYHTLDIEPSSDISSWMIEHTHDCNVPSYPFPERYFDLIVCSDVIEHVKHHEVLLTECRRILRDDGTFFLTTPNYSSLPCIAKCLAGRMFHNPCGDELERYCFNEHVRYYTTSDLIPYLRTWDWHASHLILAGLTTEIPSKGFLTKLFVHFIYNRICLLNYRWAHQMILVLQKNETKCQIVRCPPLGCWNHL